MKKKTIYYWSPFLVEITTSKAVINSVHSLQRYFLNYETVKVDVLDEFLKNLEKLIKRK
tara:strand:- start:292 stop:468 length:177 start_codon:yes stop_codon:yes gene_type:complete